MSVYNQRDSLAAEKKALERKGAAMAEKLKKAWEEAEFLKQMNASLVANQAREFCTLIYSCIVL
jgi:hypothetical protein